MSKLRMLVGSIVEAGAGNPGAVSAYIAYNAAPGESRLFKVAGPTDAPEIAELESATTVDIGRWRQELKEDLAPTVDAINEAGGSAAITAPKAEWVSDFVRRHLKSEHGIDVA